MNGFYALARYFYKKSVIRRRYDDTVSLLVTATIALCFCGNNVLWSRSSSEYLGSTKIGSLALLKNFIIDLLTFSPGVEFAHIKHG